MTVAAGHNKAEKSKLDNARWYKCQNNAPTGGEGNTTCTSCPGSSSSLPAALLASTLLIMLLTLLRRERDLPPLRACSAADVNGAPLPLAAPAGCSAGRRSESRCGARVDG